MIKNTSGQYFTVFAYSAVTGLPVTGDAANITAYIAKDGGSVTALGDTSSAELSSTNAAGYYRFDATQAETNATSILVSAKSSTSNVIVIGAPAAIFPVAATPDVNVAQIDGSTVAAEKLRAERVSD